MERKVIKMGDSSLVVSLPKVWVNKAQIKRGSSVEVGELRTGELIIKPKIVKEKKIEAVLDATQRHLRKSIIDYYINGADVIKISSDKPLDPDTMGTVFDAIKDLPGLEVTEATAKGVVIEYLGGVIPFKKLFGRFALIVTNQLKSAKTAFEENSGAEIQIIKKIQETDKLYYTLLRNLVMASVSVKAATEMNLETRESIYYTLLIRNFREMARHAGSVDFQETKYNDKISYFFGRALNCHRKFLEAWKKKNRVLAWDAMDEVEEILREVRTFKKEVKEESSFAGMDSRIAKVKKIVVGTEIKNIRDLLETIERILYYLNRNLEIATLNCT